MYQLEKRTAEVMFTKAKNWFINHRYARTFEKFTLAKIAVLKRGFIDGIKDYRTTVRWTSLVDVKLRDRFIQRMRKRGFTIAVDDDLVAGFIAISWRKKARSPRNEK